MLNCDDAATFGEEIAFRLWVSVIDGDLSIDELQTAIECAISARCEMIDNDEEKRLFHGVALQAAGAAMSKVAGAMRDELTKFHKPGATLQ